LIDRSIDRLVIWYIVLSTAVLRDHLLLVVSALYQF